MVSGSRMTAKTICILRGSTTVPSHRPSDAVRAEAATMTRASTNQFVTWMCGPWPGACTQYTTGKTIAAPMNAWIAPAVIFWMARTRIGTGARARSSIVRCQENSMTRGIVVPNMPCMRNMEPIRPGTRMVEKLMPPAAAPAAAARRGRAPADREAAADLGQHVGEDEREQQRLHDRADERGRCVPAEH